MCGDDTSNHKILGQRLNLSQGLNPKKKEGISVTVKKCRNCGLIYSSPLPVPHQMSDHYGLAAEDYWSPEFFNYSTSWFAREVTVLQQLLPFYPGQKALDIGAGLGKTMVTLEKSGYDAYGFEPSQSFYEKAVSHIGIKPDRLKLNKIETVEYPEEEFDFISFGAVFEHLYHPAAALEKALKWLKPGGIIHMEIPSTDYLVPKIIDFYFRLRGTNYTTHLSPMHNPFHLYEFSLKSYQELSKKLGFSIVKHEYMVCNISPQIPKFLHGIFRAYMQKTNTGMQLVVWLKK